MTNRKHKVHFRLSRFDALPPARYLNLDLSENLDRQKKFLEVHEFLISAENSTTLFETLRIYCHNFDDQPFVNEMNEILVRIIRSNNKNVKNLEIENFLNEEGCADIANALCQNSFIKALRMRGCGIGTKGVKTLAQMTLENDCTLEELSLYSNELGDEGAIAISSALSNNVTLKKLVLFDCDIGSKGAKALAKALSKTKKISLEDLDLSSNPRIGYEGVRALVKNTKTKLKRLSLAFYVVGNKGAKAIAESLKDKECTLETLDISKNGIDMDGVIAIADALAFNSNLKTLFLGENAIMDPNGCRCCRAMEHALRTNYVLTCVEFFPFVNNSRKMKKGLEFNRNKPVEAETTKTGALPRPSLLCLSAEVATPESCFVQALAKVIGYGNMSAVYGMIRERPTILKRHIEVLNPFSSLEFEHKNNEEYDLRRMGDLEAQKLWNLEKKKTRDWKIERRKQNNRMPQGLTGLQMKLAGKRWLKI